VKKSDEKSEWEETSSLIRPDFRRDDKDRPLITHPKTGLLTPYRRTSKYGAVLEDSTFLDAWDRRMVAYGMAHEPELAQKMLNLPTDHRSWTKTQKNVANSVTVEAKSAARADRMAEIGTDLHEMTELLDLGKPLPSMPLAFEDALGHYEDVLKASGIKVIKDFVECRMVCDPMRAAGTADRIVSFEGNYYIFDVKTGTSTFGGMTYAVQLALYAASLLYDPADGVRLPTPPMSRTRGIICRLPSDGSSCELKWIDIAKGWRAAKAAQQVYEFQQERAWYQDWSG